ncbi:hypothetical protein IMZ11_26735 [Microtetraspora sp. AC03309]|uniref:hypothetical protein n=1 Tax=Microtetraspora sp. AC03309 TaxID=2779376 RepID=UPI001E5550C5|nr:hypothetical protein [Microtetraspora sp. AC03309]MCC5579229.1 hypothetical protein [Microtetraspora sp. AC03309]
MRHPGTIPQLPEAFRPGDYVEIAVDQYGADVAGSDVRFARVERCEHLPSGSIATSFGDQPCVAILCHGMPGPLLLHGGDHRMLAQIDPAREEHDRRSPWWQLDGAPFFAGARIRQLGDGDDWRCRVDPASFRTVAWPSRDAPPRSPRRAATVTMPASALAPGDYLEAIGVRYPEGDRTADEGFVRIQWVGALDRDLAAQLVARPDWHNDRLVLVTMRGSADVLVLRPDHEVRILAWVNPERAAWEGSLDAEGEGPPGLVSIQGLQAPTPAELEHAAAIRAQCQSRVQVPDDEISLYPQRYTDAAERRQLLEGVNGVRMVPLSALPWPHNLFKCAHRQRADDVLASYPAPDRDGGAEQMSQAAHAELFGQMTAEDFAACLYHQVNWQAIGEVARRAVEQHDGDWEAALARSDSPALTDDDTTWLSYLFADPLCWNDGEDSFVNGQHRACALRVAGVPACPVDGRYIPTDSYPSALPARDHAQQFVTQFWFAYLKKRLKSDALVAVAARFLIARPALRRLLFGNPTTAGSRPGRSRRGASGQN